MITVYKVDENGQILSIQIEKNQLIQYQNLGWSETKPVNILGAIEGDEPAGSDVDFLDRTTTTPDLVDRNILYAKVLVKPTQAIEFIAIDFVVTRTRQNLANL